MCFAILEWSIYLSPVVISPSSRLTQLTAFIVAAVALFFGVLFILAGLYFDHLVLLARRARAERRGYTTVPDSVTDSRDLFGTSESGGASVGSRDSGSRGSGGRSHFEIQV